MKIFDQEKIFQSKRELRRQLAARPVAEKLAMLDILRERTLALRGARLSIAEPGIVREDPAAYQSAATRKLK